MGKTECMLQVTWRT